MQTQQTEIQHLLQTHLAQAGREAPAEASVSDLLRQALQLDEAGRTALLADLLNHLDGQLEAGSDHQPSDIDYAGLDDGLIAGVQESLDWAALLAAGYLDVPLLAPDEDIERLLARQKEMMDYCFGGIGQEKKASKRAGLAMQQYQIEQ